MSDDIGWIKILFTALTSSFLTAWVSEPLKARVQRRMKRKELRRSLYWEMSNNFGALLCQVWFAESNHVAKEAIGRGFAMGYQRISYDLALKDAPTFYMLRNSEVKLIIQTYQHLEHALGTDFNSGDQRLHNAQIIVELFLGHLKNRELDKRLMFSVSPKWTKDHFREKLPVTTYIDVRPPSTRDAYIENVIKPNIGS
jgi:hypothetical protein